MTEEAGLPKSIDGDDAELAEPKLQVNAWALENALDKLQQLRGYTFEWFHLNFDAQGMRVPGAVQRDVALKAPDVQAVLPEAVFMDSNAQQSIAYFKLVPLLVEGINALALTNRHQETELLRITNLLEACKTAETTLTEEARALRETVKGYDKELVAMRAQIESMAQATSFKSQMDTIMETQEVMQDADMDLRAANDEVRVWLSDVKAQLSALASKIK
jgi:hypothetical protein